MDFEKGNRRIPFSWTIARGYILVEKYRLMLKTDVKFEMGEDKNQYKLRSLRWLELALLSN